MLKNKKGIIIRLRESRTFKGMSVFVLLNFLFEIIQPNVSLALTEGPSQPEVQSFEPVTTTQMVDPFSGDFNYNIPLFNLPGPNGGYPVNLAYHAGSTMDDEASWVGLGWNINVGSLVRSMRGLPDEFESHYKLDENGVQTKEVDGEYDYLEVKSDIKQSWTLGVTGSKSWELFGLDADKLSGGISANLSVYYNNYNGVGVSYGGGFGLGKKDGKSSYGASLSLDKENGLGVSAEYSLSAGTNKYDQTVKHNLSIGFNGSLSVDYSISKMNNSDATIVRGTKKNGESRKSLRNTGGKSANFGSSISFARSTFTPSITNKLNTYSLSFSLNLGSEQTGFFNKFGTSIFYNTQDINNDDIKGRKHAVIGYAKEGNNNDERFTRDFSRSNDGLITKDSKFLATSQYTYDIFNSTGQELSGYFRARRSDIGRSFDPFIRNNSYGLSGGIDLGAGNTAKLGTDISASYGNSVQGAWSIQNNAQHEFKSPETLGYKENVYYKAHGEQTILYPQEMKYINDDKITNVKLGSVSYSGKKEVQSSTLLEDERVSSESERVVRNTLIHTLKNKEVENLGEFQVKYLDYNLDYQTDKYQTPQTLLSRDTRNNVKIEDHPAGYKVLNQEGAYYVYGLPAYNNSEIDNLFTVERQNSASSVDEVGYTLDSDGEVDYKVNGTYKFINKTTKSPYAHSYLLTSVQGADYVDVDNNGPSDNDLGYWVKFNYVKYTDNYMWRAPYTDAKYHQGQPFNKQDDKASYAYGEKEVWYVGQMETKSHIAIFEMSERQDMKEANGEHNDNGGTLKSGLQLNKIKIYEKKALKNASNPDDVTPLQVITFEYNIDNVNGGSYSLCQEAPNSNSDYNGKLTLTGLYFTSNGSQRGAQNKYEFSYGTANTIANPNYEKNAYDVWGNYKPLGTNYEHHSNFPYVNQFNQDWGDDVWESFYTTSFIDDNSKALTKQTQDDIASAWCLKNIKLPSGGEINIEYESDDYGYVQHKTANQMFKIQRMGATTGLHPLDENELYKEKKSGTGYENYFDQAGNRRIYFKLEEPISIDVDNVDDQRDTIYKLYVDPLIEDEKGDKNLYFKSKMKLTSSNDGFVSGYLPLEANYSDYYGVDENTIYNGYYTMGYVTLKQAEKRERNNGSIQVFHDYHPMALAAWIYLQTNAQMLLSNPNSLQDNGNYNSLDGLMDGLVDMFNIVPATATNFGLIRAYCREKGFARFIHLDESVIRLASPDKIKFGGGHRVKQISITDQWSSQTNGNEIDRTYGQAYDYTIEEDGRLISSGVAQYEPQAGGDENALKYPVYYFGKHNVFTKNNLFAEAPFNEDLYPGASVGYRKVTVTSLNTRSQIDKKIAYDENSSNPQPEGRTGGVTVYEFYTSKEFPTIFEYSNLAEENNTKDVFNLPILIPLIGSIKRNYFHGTQAYKIELNDMHGKPKSVETFGLNDYRMNLNPITASYYEYQSKPKNFQGEEVFVLDNEVDVIENNGSHGISGQKRTMGVEYDMFTDQRESSSFYQGAGVEFNTDIVGLIPILPVWPSFSNHKTLMRTYVTNKVIHRSGILKKTISKDVQTSSETEIVAYDEKSGQPLLTKVKNEFGDELYSYNIPAYYHFDRMGHAYQNINYNFNTTISNYTSDYFNSGQLFKFLATQDNIDYLVRGDEFLIDACEKIASGNFNITFEEAPNPVVTLFDVEDQYDGIVQVGDEVYEYHYNSSTGKYILTYTDNRGGETIFYYDQQNVTVESAMTCDPNSSYTYQKAYFLGWEYEGANTYGIISFMTPLPNSTNVDMDATLKVIRSGHRNHYATMSASYLSKGMLDIGANDLVLRANLDGSSISTKVIESNLLSASAVMYTDSWSANMGNDDAIYSNSFVQAVDRDINPFISGNSGIFRPFKSYTYVGKRKSSGNMANNSVSDPNLREDGVFNGDVPMFSWELGNIEDYVSNWEWVNETTRFSNDSYETENKNRLGIYSSALYGYDNSLTIAVGGNASYHELGFEDFETIASATSIEERMKQNNMNFYKDPAQKNYVIVSETEAVKKAQYSSGKINFVIDNPTQTTIDFFTGAIGSTDGTESTFGLALTSEKSNASAGNQNYFLNGACTAASYDAPTNKLTVEIKPYLHHFSEPKYALKDGTLLYGKVTMFEQRYLNTGDNSASISYTTQKAHTGSSSLLISSETDFDQPMLKAIKDKMYIASFWISRDNDKVASYQPTDGSDLIVPGYFSGIQFFPLGDYSIIYGKVVEGWQKIDIEFSFDLDRQIVAFQFKPGIETMYVDDIRFSPKTGGITTYVYDKDKYWLKASLNVDNYATLFYYDEEGNLNLKKQETEKGIFTISESRGHIVE